MHFSPRLRSSARSLSFGAFGALLAFAGRLAAQAAVASTPLKASAGWRAEQIHHSDGGVWYLHVDKVVDYYGANEVIVADDKGRFLLLSVYSGQWTAHQVTPDGQWLAPTRSADVDPRVPGREMYGAGRGGSVHRVTLRAQPFAKFTLESVEIGHVGGEEFHAVVAGDFVPGGNAELLAFALTGAVYQLAPSGDQAAFSMREVAQVPGRVRDVVVVPGSNGAPPVLLGVSRSGDLIRMQMLDGKLQHAVLLREDCGLGRIAAAKGRNGVFYVTRDDGVVVRAAVSADGSVTRQAIFAGGQGLRGIASGRFFSDDREAIAAYGYDATVHLIWRHGNGPWQTEAAFQSPQRGHWLAVGELDGRNATDELVASGFDGDVVLLSRPPGYGLGDVAVAAAETAGAAAKPATDGALRIAARVGRATADLSPLRYGGGFETKTLLFETLVRFGADGRIAPGLATSWRREDGGKTFVFTLREGAIWHDGAPVTADDVALHFRRWVGLPEHDWLRCNARIVAVRATGPRELRVELDGPAALLADLTAINPTAVLGRSAWSREGEFRQPIGSGPFRLVGPIAGDRGLRYQRVGGTRLVDLVRVDGDPVDALLRGDIDAVVGGYLLPVDPARAMALRNDPRVQVVDGPGSAMWHLAMRWHQGPLADLAARRAVAAAIDRDELVRVVARGFGDASRSYAAPSIVDWPRGAEPPAGQATAIAPANVCLRLLAGDADELLVSTVRAQLQRHGITTELLASDSATSWDLRLERTFGVPYDPFTIVERFGARSERPTAATPASAAMSDAPPRDAELVAAIDALLAAADEATWPQHYARIQARLDALLPLVPLFAPRRIALVRRGERLPKLDHGMYGFDLDWLR